MSVKIDIPNTGFATQTITLNKASYIVESEYSSRFDTWSISLFSVDGTAILRGEKVVPKQEWLTRYNMNNILGGWLGIYSKNDTPVTRDNFGLDKEHVLLFISESEVTDASTVS